MCEYLGLNQEDPCDVILTRLDEKKREREARMVCAVASVLECDIEEVAALSFEELLELFEASEAFADGDSPQNGIGEANEADLWVGATA